MTTAVLVTPSLPHVSPPPRPVRGHARAIAETVSGGPVRDSLGARAPWDSLRFPAGTAHVAIENLDGITLVPVTLRGTHGRDTAGTLVLDTGAGALALDHDLGRHLGITEAESLSAPVMFASSPLPRLVIGMREIDQPTPTLLVDAGIMRRALDRPVLGLLGQQPLAHSAVIVDDDQGWLALIPVAGVAADSASRADSVATDRRDATARSRTLVGFALSPRAVPVPVRIGGDGKILLEARLTAPTISAPRGDRTRRGTRRKDTEASAPPRAADSLTLILDTGATKCVLFADALRPRFPEIETWPSLRGLSAPTLFGTAPARVVRLGSLEAGAPGASMTRPEVDAILISGPLANALEAAVGETVHGLLGYSFFQHHRLAIDYANRVVWIDPPERTPSGRPFEFVQPGIQIERVGGVAAVSGVVAGSPAERAGVVTGDQVLRVGRLSADSVSVLDLVRALEGPDGTGVQVRIRRGKHERTLNLVRRRLL